MVKASTLILLAALAAPVAAQADCAYELGQLKAKLQFVDDKVERARMAKQLAIAEQERRTSESECRNIATRVWRDLRQPPAAQPVDASGRPLKKP